MDQKKSMLLTMMMTYMAMGMDNPAYYDPPIELPEAKKLTKEERVLLKKVRQEEYRRKSMENRKGPT